MFLIRLWRQSEFILPAHDAHAHPRYLLLMFLVEKVQTSPYTRVKTAKYFKDSGRKIKSDDRAVSITFFVVPHYRKEHHGRRQITITKNTYWPRPKSMANVAMWLIHWAVVWKVFLQIILILLVVKRSIIRVYNWWIIDKFGARWIHYRYTLVRMMTAYN